MILENNTKLFYDKNGIIVRDAEKIDLLHLAEHMRKADQEEIWASHNLMPLEALIKSFEASATCLVAIDKGEPFSIFGSTPSYMVFDKAIIWMLATDHISKVRMEFYRYSRHFVDILLQDYPVLFNYVDCRNTRSILWLKKIGAKVEEPKPYGLEGLPFCYFSFERN